MKRLIAAGTAVFAATALLPNACGSESKPGGIELGPSSPRHIDTAAEAQSKLTAGRTVSGFVVLAAVDLRHPTEEGGTVAFNPLRFEDERLWYAVCNKAGNVVLKPLVPASEQNVSEEYVRDIVPFQEPCGVAALRPGYMDNANQVAYVGIPRGDQPTTLPG